MMMKWRVRRSFSFSAPAHSARTRSKMRGGVLDGARDVDSDRARALTHSILSADVIYSFNSDVIIIRHFQMYALVFFNARQSVYGMHR